MPIVLKNSQVAAVIDTWLARRQLSAILDAVRCPDYDLAVWLTTDRRIRLMNNSFRRVNKPTDILSFPTNEHLTPGTIPDPQLKALGDIIISVPYVIRQGFDVKHRLPVLFTHGVCHLLGYDHETDDDYDKMKAREDAILERLAELDLVDRERIRDEPIIESPSDMYVDREKLRHPRETDDLPKVLSS
ncbi:Endoribonuclease YbeY [Plasmodiophora brassicae]